MSLPSRRSTRSSLSRKGFVGLTLAVALACAGPAGKEGPQGPPGPPGSGPDGGTTPVAQTQETCTICHGTGQIADAVALHKADSQLGNPGLARSFATISSVSNVGTKPTIVFTVSGQPDGGSPVAGLSSFNFTVAQLVPTDATGGNIDNWRPLMNRNYLAADAGSISPGGATEVSVNARAATTPAAQLSGVLSESPPGTYTYTFGNDLSVPVADAGTLPTYGVVSVAFDPTLTTRIGLQSGAPLPGQAATTAPNGTVINPTPPFTGTVDVLSGGALASPTDSRQIVTAQACDQCHQRLTAHGRRINVNYCVTCHNSSSFDPQTPANNRQTVDFKRVIHKLHMGKNLPSVKAGTPFLFNGQDFSDVTFPRITSNSTSDPGDCTVCHNADSATAGAPADAWKTQPTMVACASCHDGTSFTDTTLPACNTNAGNPPYPCMHSGGAQVNDSGCVLCHATGSGVAPIDNDGGTVVPQYQYVHTGLAAFQADARNRYKYNILGVASTAPGQAPVVTFQVTSADGGVVYNLTEPAWNQTANGNSRLAIDIAWSTGAADAGANTNYTNEGSGANPGQPVTIDALKNKVQVDAGVFTVTSPVAVPTNATGIGEVVMEGHPAEPIGFATPPTQQRIPVPSATKTFAITGTATTARRSVVDINKCNVCHGNLSLHGNNRTSRIEACVACHNANATDINQRPKTGTTADGKAEESIDFKKLIHGIHGADFSGAGPIIYGFGGSVNDFSNAGFPGVISNCEGCHNPNTYGPSFADAKGTTTSTETLTDSSTYLRTTKITATCSACHAGSLFTDHMQQMGGAFDVTQAQIDAAK